MMKSRKYILYRIYYDEKIVYLGRTMQPLQDRIRGHLFNKPMQRELDINKISKIEFATFKSQADMYLYEIYFINLWHPALNRDDKAPDNLTVALPDVKWDLFTTHLWDKWKKEIESIDLAYQNRRKAEVDMIEKKNEMREKRRNGEITDEEYLAFLDEYNIFFD